MSILPLSSFYPCPLYLMYIAYQGVTIEFVVIFRHITWNKIRRIGKIRWGGGEGPPAAYYTGGSGGVAPRKPELFCKKKGTLVVFYLCFCENVT